jgi:predicted ATP-grasp superfamily ATP-dependent carboligase
MPTIAVAGISARAMAEAAAGEGLRVVALDLFGDVDTRHLAARWLPIGTPATLQIEPERLMSALRLLAQQGASPVPVCGWIPGSGFEGQADLLEAGAAVLPMIGTAPAAVRRLRDPAQFFGFLAARGLPHPTVRLQPPADPAGWLLKDAHGCGGWHVRRAPAPDDAPPDGHHYYQREMRGQPMSATFVANRRDVQVLGFNMQSVRAIGTRPFVFCGVVGPVPVSPGVEHRVSEAARAITREFGLRGLASLDFMLDGDTIGVLEVNPRPPASLSLYAGPLGAPGVMRAHLRACLQGELPPPRPTPAPQVGGLEIVYARQPFELDGEAAQRLAAWPGIRDLPGAGQRFAADDPLCSLTASGADPDHVRTRLRQGREQLLQFLETTACATTCPSPTPPY